MSAAYTWGGVGVFWLVVWQRKEGGREEKVIIAGCEGLPHTAA